MYVGEEEELGTSRVQISKVKSNDQAKVECLKYRVY